MKSSGEKKLKIKDSLQKTREKRSHQVCKVYLVKIDESKLNIPQKLWINKLFLEAKWFHNYIISRDDLFNLDTKLKNVLVKNKSGQDEWRKLNYLSSQMKQELHARILDSIKGLSILKKKGYKVGRIKYTKNINSIPLKQFKNTWSIQNGRIKVQGLKKTLPVNGLDQVPPDVDFANAVLLRKASGYYIAITTYLEKQTRVQTGLEVGLDFGIKDNLVTSDGEKFNISIPETKKLKRLQKIYSKKTGTTQKRKVNLQVRKEYERIGNQKHDKVNKIVSHLVKNYDKIYMQDEMIKSWHSGLFGKQVQHSAMGAIKARLKKLESVSVISRSYPSTKKCYQCGKMNYLSFDGRVYRCSCGLEEDRDIKAAKTIMKTGKLIKKSVDFKLLPTEYRNTLLENLTSVEFDRNIKLDKLDSMKEENATSLA